MKNGLIALGALFLLLPFWNACTDLSGIEAEIAKTTTSVSKLEDAVSLFQKAYNEGKLVSKVERTSDNIGWKITFADNTSIILLDAGNNGYLIDSIVKEEENGIVILTMKDGSKFTFNMDLSYPTSVIPTADTLYISPKGSASFSVIVNPSNAYINTNLQDSKCSVSISVVDSKGLTGSKNLKLSGFEVVKDADNKTKDGLFSVTLSDLGQQTDYIENIKIIVRSKDNNGDSLIVTSSVITVVSLDLFQDFSIGGAQSEVKNGLVFVQLPKEVDVKKLKPTFSSCGKVYVNGVEQVSGVSVQDFSCPVQYTAVANDGTEKKYFVCVTNGNIALVNINTPAPQINTFQNNATIETFYASTDQSFSNVRIKGYDNLSWELEKKSYEIDLGKSSDFLGMKSHTSFILLANHSDKTFLRNEIAFRMNSEIFDNIPWVPSSIFAHVILNGNYIGYYQIAESVRIGKNRINIPDIEACQSSSAVNKYGYLLEVNDRKDRGYNFATSRGVNFSLVSSYDEEIPSEYKNHIKNYIQVCENALFASDFTSRYKNYIDINSFVDWFLLNEIAKNCNSNFHINCYMYFNPSDQKLHMGPIWDCTIAYGNINFVETELYYDWWVTQKKWYKQMFEDPEFKYRVKNRWNEKKYELDKWLKTEIQQEANTISDNVAANFSVWPILGKYVWPNPKGFDKRTTYQSEVDFLTDWVKARVNWMDSEIRTW